MAFCTRCGHELSPGAAFCAQCGAAVQGAPQASSQAAAGVPSAAREAVPVRPEDTAPSTVGATRPSVPAASSRTALVPAGIAGIGALLVAIGAVLPWGDAGFVAVRGIEGDGMITLAVAALGLVALLSVLKRARVGIYVLEILLALVAAAVGFYDLFNMPAGLVGNGLYLTAIAGVIWLIGALAGVYLAARGRRAAA